MAEQPRVRAVKSDDSGSGGAMRSVVPVRGPSLKVVRMKPLSEELANDGGQEEVPDFAGTASAGTASASGSVLSPTHSGLLSPNRHSRRRSSSRTRTPVNAVTAGEVLHEVVQETEIWAALACQTMLRQVGVFWSFAHPLWLPLLGLVTLGTAFTVPVWLAIPDILTGIILVHIRCWQDWVRVGCHWPGKTCQVPNVERAFAVIAVVLGLIALMYRVSFSGAGHLAVLDLVGAAFSIGGAASAWCKPSTAPVPHMREVPARPLLILFLAVSTLAPAPGLASLPYALLFLALLAMLVRRSGLHPLSFGMRIGLLVLTTLHLVALLILSFLGEEGSHPVLLDVFGVAGKAVAFNEGAQRLCFPNDNAAGCPGTGEFFWPVVHVTALLLLHFVLTNVTSMRPKRPSESNTPELSTADGLGAKAWTKAAVRWGLFASLVMFVLWFPNLMTLPLLFMAFSLTVEKSGLTRCYRCFCDALRSIGRIVRCQKTEPAEALHLHWKGRYVCVYMALIFLACYLFNISQGDLPGKPRVAAWLDDKLHLKDSVHWPQPVVTTRRTWLQCIGLEDYGAQGPARAASAFFPQAGILALVAWLQSILDDPGAPRPHACQMIGKAFERLWFVVAAMMGPEVAMAAVLFLNMMVLSCEDGLSSIIMVAYMTSLVVIMTSGKVIRAQLWLLLQCLAECSSILLVLIYVFNAPSMKLVPPFDKFVTVTCKSLSGLVAPHLGIALVAGLQRVVAQAGKTNMRRSGTGDNFVEESNAPKNRVRNLKVWLHVMEYLDRKAIRRMKLFVEELIVLAVMILSLVTTLLPPVDVHSLAILAVVGPALLIYNLEDDREKLLLRVLQLLQFLTAIFLLGRIVVASPLFPMPADTWFISLQELGMTRPVGDSRKPLFLGLVTILTRVAIREARMAIKEINELETEAIAEKQRQQQQEQQQAQEQEPAAAGLIPADVASPSRVNFSFGIGLDGPPEDIRPSQPAELLQSREAANGDNARAGDEAARPTHFGVTNSRASRMRTTSPTLFRTAESGRSSGDSLVRKRHRKETRRKMGPRWEERMMMKWAPGWLPLKAHAYISALLLVMSFAVSITEVHLLNFLMITAVVSLCGWYELWVQAGNVFSVTTVGIMLIQYVARFAVWEDAIPDFWFQVLGLRWSNNQVVRHCAILSLCLLQKQLWHRGRYSKPRAPNCPRWLSKHAELIGMAALLLVAVARRHSLSPLLAFAALPWLVREEYEDMALRLSFFARGHRLTRSWLRFFRLILLLTLMSQVVMRLMVEFAWEEKFDPFFDWHCSFWEADVTITPGNNATKNAPAQARRECIEEWRSYSSMLRSSGEQMLWEFLALFLLGMVQQLFERRDLREEAEGRTASSETSRWKLVVMHWWIVLVYALTFVLSLEGGSVMGMLFLSLLLAVTFSNGSSGAMLAKRQRWVWRCQLCAWICLFIGLMVQSPLLPCGRASCHGEVHRTFMRRDECVALQELNVTLGESESTTANCGKLEQGFALGHDTFATLAMQVAGFRRIGGNSFWDDLWNILGSQLGTLLQLILACSVQLRISSSKTYREKVEAAFIGESQALCVERARRFVHEFFCRYKIEEMASRERRRALRDKLKRVMRKINDILAGRAAGYANAKDMDDAKHDLLVEELQLSHGVKKEVAREVTAMFDYDMGLSKEYLDLLKLVMLGRMQPDSANLQRTFERLQQNATTSRLCSSSRGAVRTAKHFSMSHHPDLYHYATHSTATSSSLSSLQSRQKALQARLKSFQGWAQSQWKSAMEQWDAIKRGKIVSWVMTDYAFLCTDEVRFSLRPASAAAAEELDAHRQDNGPIRLLWKVALSNMMSLVAVASVLAFIETRSILDVVRAFAVFFVALHSYPFPPRELWIGLLAFNVAVLVMRTFYDLPILCAGPSLRTVVDKAHPWEPANTVLWCPGVATSLSMDVTFGVAKRRGASALNQSSWIWAVWADHLCIWTVLLHQWMLTRSGLWEHVAFDQESKQCFLHSMGHVEEAPRGSLASSGPPDLPSALRVPKVLQAPSSSREGSKEGGGGAVVVSELDVDLRHRAQVVAAMKVRDRLVAEYYDMLQRDGSRAVKSKTWTLEGEHVPHSEHSGSPQRPAEPEAPPEAPPEEHGAAQPLPREQGDSLPVASHSTTPAVASHSTASDGQASPRSPWAQSGRLSSHLLQGPSHILSGHSGHLQSHLPSQLLHTADHLLHTGAADHLRGVLRARANQFKVKVPWLAGEPAAEKVSKPPEVCDLYLFCLDGTEEQVELKLHALIQLQRACRRFLERQKKARRIRCLMGHPLIKDWQIDVISPCAKKATERDYQVCERCSKIINTSIRYSCKECDYHACSNCVQTLLALDQAMGKQDGVRERSDCRPGIAVYWLKYLLGLLLLCYFLLANTAIFASEAKSTFEAVQTNNISTHTLGLLTVHLMLLITDRIFHKWHYRNSEHDISLKIVERLNLLFLLAEFFWVHSIIIAELRSKSNLRDIRLPLYSESALCLYYCGWMTYLGVCIAQRKYGLPAVDHDTLRPTAPPDTLGITMEKFYTFSWYLHYALPFVDDLRVIIDWSVMPTSLDLWMHFKVEDAHSWLFRTRHAMYIRRQSFFAERRDSCEKVYSGWLIVLLLVFIILMPLLIFSPITPFQNNVDIEGGTMVLDLGVATGCLHGEQKMECRFSRINLFEAEPGQILKYNQTQKTSYLQQQPSAPSTDIDIQEVEWPADSLKPLQVSYAEGKKVQRVLEADNIPVLFYFRLAFTLKRGGEKVELEFSTDHVVCYCAPAGTCKQGGWHWPMAADKVCSGHGVTPSDSNMSALAKFWQELGRGGNPAWDTLPRLWESKVTVGTTGANKQGQTSDVLFGLTNCSSNCEAGWCGAAHCWGRMQNRKGTTVIYELERSATLNSLSASSTSFSVIGLYLAVVLVAGRYLRAAFQDSSKRAIYEEIPDVGAFLDLVTAIKLAREHRDLRTEFQLYYCLMKVLRSTNLLLTTGGHEPRRYGAGRSDEQPPECEEPRETRIAIVDRESSGAGDTREPPRRMRPAALGGERSAWPQCFPRSSCAL